MLKQSRHVANQRTVEVVVLVVVSGGGVIVDVGVTVSFAVTV